MNESSAAPVKVAGGLTFSTISAGKQHTCALEASNRADGAAPVWCWGAKVDPAGTKAVFGFGGACICVPTRWGALG